MDRVTAALAAAKVAKTCAVDYQKFRYVTAEMRDIPAHRVGVLHLAMRPRFVLADGCIDGDALINVNRGGAGRRYRLRDAYAKFNGLWPQRQGNWDPNIPMYARALCDGELHQHRVEAVLAQGVRPVVKLTLKSGRTLRLTPDHEVAQPSGGWIPVEWLVAGDTVLTNGAAVCSSCGSVEDLITYPYAKFVGHCKRCMYRGLRTAPNRKGRTVRAGGYIFIPSQFEHPRAQGRAYYVPEHVLVMEEHVGRYLSSDELVHHKDENPSNNALDNLELTDCSGHHVRHRRYRNMAGGIGGKGGLVQFFPTEDTVVSVEPDGETDVYDMVMADPHRNFVANGVIVHNCGLGKSNQAEAAFCYLLEKDPGLKLLILTKASAVLQWLGSIRRFTHLQALASGYTPAGDREIPPTARRRQWADPSTVMVTSYQRAARDLDLILDYTSRFVLILDEVHQLRGAEHQQVLFPAAQRLSLKARCVWGLTATPLYTRVEDLYAVFEAVWPGFFGSSRAAFQDQYLIRTKLAGSRRWKTVGLKNTAELTARVEPYLLKRPAEEIQKHLPEVILEPRPIVLGKTQRAFYAEVSAGRLPRSLTETQSLHKDAIWGYQQLAADMPSVLTSLPVPSAKAEALDDIIEEYKGQKLIVFSRFELVIDALAAGFKARGVRVATITGQIPALVRERQRQAFQDPQSGLDLILIDGAGGEALDLQAAGILVMFDLPWSWGELSQILGRTRRIGSHHPSVLALMLIAPHTTDTYTYTNLTSKEYTINAILHLPSSDLLFNTTTTNSNTRAFSSSNTFSEREEGTLGVLPDVPSSSYSSAVANQNSGTHPSGSGTVRRPVSSSIKDPS